VTCLGVDLSTAAIAHETAEPLLLLKIEIKGMIPREKRNVAHMAFEITTREFDRIIVVDAVGRLTLNDSRTRLRDLIHVFTSNGHRDFLLNLAGVDFIDSDGMGELVRCYSVVRQRGGEMRLVHLQQRVHDLLQITRVNSIFEIHSDEQVALQAFRQRS
jgi:anti-sigma B factor antagonist